eukprot:2483653-Rhodomonas_salina.2
MLLHLAGTHHLGPCAKREDDGARDGVDHHLVSDKLGACAQIGRSSNLETGRAGGLVEGIGPARALGVEVGT